MTAERTPKKPSKTSNTFSHFDDFVPPDPICPICGFRIDETQSVCQGNEWLHLKCQESIYARDLSNEEYM